MNGTYAEIIWRFRSLFAWQECTRHGCPVSLFAQWTQWPLSWVRIESLSGTQQSDTERRSKYWAERIRCPGNFACKNGGNAKLEPAGQVINLGQQLCTILHWLLFRPRANNEIWMKTPWLAVLKRRRNFGFRREEIEGKSRHFGSCCHRGDNQHLTPLSRLIVSTKDCRCTRKLRYSINQIFILISI